MTLLETIGIIFLVFLLIDLIFLNIIVITAARWIIEAEKEIDRIWSKLIDFTGIIDKLTKKKSKQA